MAKKQSRGIDHLKGEWTVAEISIQYKGFVMDKQVLTYAEDVYVLIKRLWCEETIGLQEQFMALFLNGANQMIGYRFISKGTMKVTLVDVKLLVSLALHCMATSVIMAHNHPSGNLNASPQDKAITEKIKSALELIDVKLLDHLIITSGNYASFAENASM